VLIEEDVVLLPAFQFDTVGRRIYAAVQAVTKLLKGTEDPWGVVSWWISPNARLGGRAPKDLLVEDESSRTRIILAAEAVVEPIG
jgi:hypothetical protein